MGQGLKRATAASRISRSGDAARLDRIKEIIEGVDGRCAAADGPVLPTMREITQQEISAIYALASRKPESWRPR